MIVLGLLVHQEFKMTTEITQQEAWRILDAIIAYKDDYELSVSVIKTIKNSACDIILDWSYMHEIV